MTVQRSADTVAIQWISFVVCFKKNIQLKRYFNLGVSQGILFGTIFEWLF